MLYDLPILFVGMYPQESKVSLLMTPCVPMFTAAQMPNHRISLSIINRSMYKDKIVYTDNGV